VEAPALTLLVHKLLEIRRTDLAANGERGVKCRQDDREDRHAKMATDTSCRRIQGSTCTQAGDLRLEMPRTKQMESRMLLLPVPLRPVMALKLGSKPVITVRLA
jgi:hypothetical protein